MGYRQTVEGVAIRRATRVAVVALSVLLALAARSFAEDTETEIAPAGLAGKGSDVLRVLTTRYSVEINRNLRTRYLLGYPSDFPLFTQWISGDTSRLGQEREAEARAAAIAAFRLTGMEILNELDVVARTRETVERYTRAEVLIDMDTVEFMGPGTPRVDFVDRPAAFRSSFAMSGGLPLGIQARFKVAGLEPKLTVYPGSRKIMSLILERGLTQRTRVSLDYRLYRGKESVIATLSYAWERDPDIPFWPAWLKFSQ